MRIIIRTRYIVYIVVFGSTAIIFGFACSDVKLLSAPPILTTVKLEIQNYCPVTGFQYVNHFVYNESAYFNGFEWEPDTDGDGLPDSYENNPTNFNTFATSFLSPDTSGNGYSDLVKVRLGLNATQQEYMPICNNPGIDTDGDGLSDCEEAMMGTDPTQADYDLDGVPDGVEVRFGMNPTDPNDAYTSSTGDEYTNLQKAKLGVTVNTFISETAKGILEVYSASPIATKPGCSTLDISNINIVPLLNGNVIHVIALEDSQNPPSGGTHSVDREARTLTVIVPSDVPTGASVIVPDGIHGQIYGGTGNPPADIVGGAGS